MSHKNMENGWVKIFDDGEVVCGPDECCSTSWSKTRLDDMCRVDLFVNGQCFSLEGKGEFHQSDDYIVLLSGEKNRPERLARRVQMKLGDKWLTRTVFSADNSSMVTLEDKKIGL